MDPLPVIYLAAGRGSRLGELCADRPKALVEVGGRPLADRAFEYLRAAGFSRIVAVTGHAAEQLGSYDIETVFNDRWDSENNITSLWQVSDVVEEGCVIVNCDLLFEPELAVRLAVSEGTAILVDERSPVDEESMKATARGRTTGELERLHKELPADEAVGEYIGLARVDPRDGVRFAEIINEFVVAGNVQVYYEDAIAALASERPVRIERVGGLRWVEIDDHVDLAIANQRVAPAIDAKVTA
ncbi:MAG: phosphocholine cytidylyltransferase family protein [Solirubrobacterales bacterium]